MRDAAAVLGLLLAAAPAGLVASDRAHRDLLLRVGFILPGWRLHGADGPDASGPTSGCPCRNFVRVGPAAVVELARR